MRSGEGGVYFVPGFPVMAWPMIEWVLDTALRRPARAGAAPRERSVIVFGAMEATLTPLMEAIEARFPGVKVFSLPSVDHPEWGRHIELGVKGDAAELDAAYAALLDGPEARTDAQARPRTGALSAGSTRCALAPCGACTRAPSPAPQAPRAVTGMLSAKF